MKDQPNILLIMADQLAPQVLPAYGGKQVIAPHLSELADKGVLFENAYCNFPLCVPSRASMMAGRYANAIEVWDNAAEMNAYTPTVAHYLRNAGYHTALCGKMHFVGPDQLHGFNERLTTDIYPANYAWTPDWTEGDRPTGISMRAVVEAGKCARSLQIDYDDEVEFFGAQALYDLARYGKDKPFFLTVSFTHPHSPFVITEKYWDLYKHEDVQMPSVPEIPLDKLDPFSRWLHFAHAQDKHTVKEEHIRNARHAYYGMTTYIDDKVGHLLQTLEHAGLDNNTIVIFTGDHGEMLGERGMWYKQAFFEWSTRVPLIVCDPREKNSKRVGNPVSLVDLLPTCTDFATDKSAPEAVNELHGKSLRKLMSGDDSDWSNTVISEYTGEGTCAPVRMIRCNNMKYIYTHGHPGMMFDLDKDPDELNNLCGNANYADIEKTLLADLQKDWNPEEVMRQAMLNQRERLFVHKATGGEPSWAHLTRPEDANRFVRNSGAVQAKTKARLPFVEPVPFEN